MTLVLTPAPTHPKKMITGTANFESEAAARRYYAGYGLEAADVAAKIADGEISIGRPKLKIGERLRVDQDGRYWIERPEGRGALALLL